MKKFYFLLTALCLFTNVDAQIINIPNYSFKQLLLNGSVASDVYGNTIDIDTNNDGEIQVSEALLVDGLNIPNQRLQSLIGIRSFSNLRRLTCYSNELTELDLSGMTNLSQLYCNSNMLTSLDLSGLTSLLIVECQQNQLTSLNLAGVSLMRLTCQDNRLTTLNVNFLATNTFTGINDVLYCYNNQLTTLNFTGYFTSLRCYDNFLTSLDVTPLTESLKELDCKNNRLTHLNIRGQYRIEKLNCDRNQLTSLDFIPTSSGSYSNLKQLSCSNNQISSLDLTRLSAMTGLYCFGNRLTTLDVNLNSSLMTLYCMSNPLLVSLLIKKQYFPSVLDFSNCPNLNFVCVKDADVPAVQAKLNQYGYTNCNINSYCSFTPAGTFYRLQGSNSFSLSNSNCSASGVSLPFLRFSISSTSGNRTVIADNTGFYNIPFQAGTYNVVPYLEGNSNNFIKSPTGLNIIFPTSSNPYIQNFCISPNYALPSNDLETVILPILPARPGFNSNYVISYKNKGNTVQSGTVSFTFDDSILDLVSTSSIANQATNVLTWNFVDLQPFETREIAVVLNLNSPTEVPSVNIGDVLPFSSSISSTNNDSTQSDNVFNFTQRVVGSYDPNDKTCLQGITIAPSEVGKYVHYMIRFENNGTANAQNIVVKDIIDTAKFDISSLLPIKGSHSFVTNITAGNKVEFIFENINLPFDDANNDGYVAFKIKTKPTLVNGDTFSNSANIYFDYNFPIVTNTATTTIQALSTQDFAFGSYFSLYPNPVSNILNIETKQTIEVSSISIYNQLGQLVLVVPNAQHVSKVDVSGLSSGNYFIKINSDKGTSNTKFIKQ